MKNIPVKLEEIIRNYGDITKLDKDANLLSSPMHLAPRDMAAVFLDIEKVFDVEICDIVAKAKFFTFNNILSAIESSIQP